MRLKSTLIVSATAAAVAASPAAALSRPAKVSLGIGAATCSAVGVGVGFSLYKQKLWQRVLAGAGSAGVCGGFAYGLHRRQVKSLGTEGAPAVVSVNKGDWELKPPVRANSDIEQNVDNFYRRDLNSDELFKEFSTVGNPQAVAEHHGRRLGIAVRQINSVLQLAGKGQFQTAVVQTQDIPAALSRHIGTQTKDLNNVVLMTSASSTRGTSGTRSKEEGPDVVATGFRTTLARHQAWLNGPLTELARKAVPQPAK